MKWLHSEKKTTFLRKRLKSVKPCFTALPNSEAGNLRKCYYVSINWIKRNTLHKNTLRYCLKQP